MIVRLLPLVWANLWRNKSRSILTVLGVAIAIFVFVSLGAAIEAMTFPVRQVGAESTLNVRQAARANVMASRLPEAYEGRVAAVPGVGAATGVLSDLAVVGERQVHIFVRGVDPEQYREVQNITVEDGAWNAFREDTRAALVGHRLLAQMGWAVGSEVEVEGMGVRVTIVGVIPPQGVDLESHMLVQRSYLQGVRSAEQQVSYVLVSPSQGRAPSEVGAAIDEAFATAPISTETTTAAGYAEAIINDFMGFIDYLKIMGLITVLITMLAAANSIAMSVRERTRELGMLKAIGFTPKLILSLIIAESMILSITGGLLGLAIAAAVLSGNSASMSGVTLSGSASLQGAVLALAIGMLGGLFPALAAARLRTVDALRVIG